MSKQILDVLKSRAAEKRILKFYINLPEDIESLEKYQKSFTELYCRKWTDLSTSDHLECRFQPLLEKSKISLYSEDVDVIYWIENGEFDLSNSICYIEKINKKEKFAFVAFYYFQRKTLRPTDRWVIYYDKEKISEDELKKFTFPLNEEVQLSTIQILSDGSFRLYHIKEYLQISLQKTFVEEYILQGKEPIKNNNIISRLQVCIGQISFKDIKEKQEEEQRCLQAEINQYRLAAAEYEGVWRQYEEEEKQELNERARTIGSIQYVAREPIDRYNWRFYIKNEDDYNVLEKEFRNGEIELTIDGNQHHAWHGTLAKMFIHRADYCVDVNTWQTNESPPESGALCLDVYAQSVRTKRRLFARDMLSGALVEKRQVVPGLRQVLMDKEWQAAIPQKCRIPSQIMSLFPAGLNESQKRALEIAYNTPDFAIIQGPPGTGKTQVISALCQWFGNDMSNRRKTLLSSFQHEAVDNLALRCRIFDIPVHRLTLAHAQQVTDVFSIWCDELRMRLIQKEKEFQKNPVFDIARRVEVWFGYLETNSPSLEKRKHILTQILDLIRDYVPSVIYDEGDILLKKWKTVAHLSDYPKQFFTLLYGLKCTEESYEDGGHDSLDSFLNFLECMNEKCPVSARMIENLRTILQKKDKVDSQDLINLEAIRNKLLDSCLNNDVLLREKNIDSVLMDDFIAHVREELEKQCSNSVNKIDNIFFQYVRTLDNDELRFRYACQKYSNAIAATTGQSVGQGMHRIMDGARFENVIVDEAARANPMDLLIPLTQAMKKIILVGDGKQLPHLVEEDKIRKVIAKSDTTQAKENISKALKTTLFERFQNAVNRQFQTDRFLRFIMLDTQYRMRPALGTMLSDAFYDGKLKNGKEDSLFTDIVPYGKLSAVWYDMETQKGVEERDRITKSVYRKCEAHKVAKLAQEILDSNPGVSLGVITFYSAQVRIICQEMKKAGVFNDDSGTVLGNAYEKRIVKVGTVDAFQGREFDVVILSTVRATNKELPEELNYDTCKSRFGHLLSPGRICVALSRQKSTLVVVGALSMFSCDIPDSGLVGFKKLIELCRSKNGKIIQ